MLSSSQHEGEALGFLSTALTGGEGAREQLAAARIEATLAVAAALTELATILHDKD
jgi:hypothetical protein